MEGLLPQVVLRADPRWAACVEELGHLWAGKKTPKGNCQPTVGEVVQALHGGRINLDWLDVLMGFLPGHTRDH